MKHVIFALLVFAAPANASEDHIACLRAIVAADVIEDRITDEWSDIFADVLSFRSALPEQYDAAMALTVSLRSDLKTARLKFQTELAGICEEIRERAP